MILGEYDNVKTETRGVSGLGQQTKPKARWVVLYFLSFTKLNLACCGGNRTHRSRRRAACFTFDSSNNIFEWTETSGRGKT